LKKFFEARPSPWKLVEHAGGGVPRILPEEKPGEEYAESAVAAVLEFEERLGERGECFDRASVEELKGYVSILVSQGRNS